jgi:hypothetical protein
MSVEQRPPSAFVHAARRLVPGGACPTCGDAIEGIAAEGPDDHVVAPCGCAIDDQHCRPLE